MPAFRIIPCLDIKDGRVVKGVRFVHLRDLGDAVALARRYRDEGADELAFLDITATLDGRRTLRALVADVAAELDIPFTVGGGVTGVADAGALLTAGADKVTVNSAAVAEPVLVERLAREFGSQCVVVAVDVCQEGNVARVVTHGGRRPTARDAVAWCDEAVARGAGEILLTSMDRDGTGRGFALELLAAVRAAVGVPVIASGGGETAAHFVAAAAAGADAGLAATIFHEGRVAIGDLKTALDAAGVPVRRGGCSGARYSIRPGGPGAGGHPGRRPRRRAHGGLHERRGAGRHPGHR